MATNAETPKIDIGRVISRGLDALGRNVLPFAGFALLLGGAPTVVMDRLLPGVYSDPAFAGSAWALPVASFVVDFLFGSLLTAILVRSAILTLNGDEADLRGSALTALRLLLPLVAMTLLSVLVIIFGLILLIVPGLIFYAALVVAVPVLIVERRGIVDSLQRSAGLTRGSRGRIFLLILLYLFGWFALSAAIGLAFGAADAAWYDRFVTAGALAQGLAAAAGTLVSSVMVASLYVELRTVKEGATLDSLATVFE